MTRRDKLTPRQRAVVQLLADGCSCPQIARRLAISVKTVRHHYEAVASDLRRCYGSSDVPALRLVRRYAPKLLEAA